MLGTMRLDSYSPIGGVTDGSNILGIGVSVGLELVFRERR